MKTIENLFTKDCIRTFTGIYMNVFEPTPEMICIEDIAHGLSHQCRFAGHTKEFYSVAQHSIHVAELAKDEFKLQALLHDSSEAYLLDMPGPIKKRLPEYCKIENNLMEVIAKKFGFEWPVNENVKGLDDLMLQWEWDFHILNKKPYQMPYSSGQAKEEFLKWFNIITKT